MEISENKEAITNMELFNLEDMDLIDDTEVWEVKAATEKEIKRSEIRQSLLMVGIQGDLAEKIIDSDVVETWESKVEENIARRLSKTMEILVTVGYSEREARETSQENLDVEEWERKVEVDKPLDDAFVNTNNMKQAERKGSILDWFQNLVVVKK